MSCVVVVVVVDSDGRGIVVVVCSVVVELRVPHPLSMTVPASNAALNIMVKCVF